MLTNAKNRDDHDANVLAKTSEPVKSKGTLQPLVHRELVAIHCKVDCFATSNPDFLVSRREPSNQNVVVQESLAYKHLMHLSNAPPQNLFKIIGITCRTIMHVLTLAQTKCAEMIHDDRD